MVNTFKVRPGTRVLEGDDHLVITGAFKRGLHTAVLFTKNGCRISGLIQLNSDGSFDDKWERCPGALEGEVVYHQKKVGAEVTPGYCEGYHKTVWPQKKGRNPPTQSC